MTSVDTQSYGVPLFDDCIVKIKGKRYQWRQGRWIIHQQDNTPTRRELEQRLANLRQVKLELEESNTRRRQIIKHLTKRLETVNQAMYSKELAHKMLFKSEEALSRAKLRMKELGGRICEVIADNDRIQNTVDKFRDEYKCKGPCGKVRSYKAFARDPGSITGRESRCNVCQREKTAKWRAAKKVNLP